MGIKASAFAYFHWFMDNSPTDQLADNPIRRQPTCRLTNSPTNQLAEIDIMMFRLTPKCNGNYESSAHLVNWQI